VPSRCSGSLSPRFAAALGRQGDGWEAGRCRSFLPAMSLCFPKESSSLPGVLCLFILASWLWPPAPSPAEERGWRLGASPRWNQERDPGFLLCPPRTCGFYRTRAQRGSSPQARDLPQRPQLHLTVNKRPCWKKEGAHKPCTHLTLMTCPRPGCSCGSGCSSPARTPVQFITTSTPWANIYRETDAAR